MSNEEQKTLIKVGLVGALAGMAAYGLTSALSTSRNGSSSKKGRDQSGIFSNEERDEILQASVEML